jgi:hypothetical protein
VWDTLTGKPLTELLSHENSVNWAQFSPDGQRVLTASGTCMRVWDALTGKPLTEPLRHEGGVISAQFSSDGLRVVTIWGGGVRVWDAQTGGPLAGPLPDEQFIWWTPTSLSPHTHVSPDGQRVVRFWGESVWVKNAQTCQPLTDPFYHEGGGGVAQFSPEGLRVLTLSSNGVRVWDAQTGQPLTGSFRHEGGLSWFSPNGRWVLTPSPHKTACIWEVPFESIPAPTWLAELAASIAGKKLKQVGIFEPVAPEEFLKLKKQLLTSTETNYYARWAKWFCSDRATRTISPLSPITVPEYVQRRIQENTLDSLHEAVLLSPTNGLAFARLAKLVLAQNEKENPRRVGEADFFSRYALNWSPNDPEVRQIRSEIERQVEKFPNPQR